MAKNRALIEQYKAQRRFEKRLDNQINKVVPELYACFALTLSYEHYGWTQEQIEALFAETQALWAECADREDIDMLEWCENETGISVELRD